MTYRGQIIDSHMHIWDPANGYAWLPHLAGGRLNHPFSYLDYLQMSRNQPISQTVYIECGGFPDNPALETKWVQEQADLYGGPQAIVAYAKLDSPHVDATLKAHRQYPNLRGIRMPLNFVEGVFGADRDDYLRDLAWQRGYSLLSKYNLSFDMQIFDTQLPDAAHLARTFPDIPLILEHLAWPQHTDLALWQKRLAPLAAQRNVFLKLSCLGWIFKDPSLIPSFLRAAVALFGPDRCLVGSNCPPDSLHISFDGLFDHFKTALGSLSERDQQKIFYGNAKRLYRL